MKKEKEKKLLMIYRKRAFIFTVLMSWGRACKPLCVNAHFVKRNLSGVPHAK